MQDNSLPWELARLVFVFYPAICLALFLAQRWMMYPASTGPITLSESEASIATPVTVTSDGQQLVGYFTPPDSADKPILLLSHGNGGNARGRLFKSSLFKDRRGWGTLIIGYRGYGQNPGKPTEEGLISDALAFRSWLVENHQQNPIVYYGESLGTGIAVAMATEHAIPQQRLLVLEAAYSSTLDVARKTYFWLPLRMLMLDQYRSDTRIAGLNIPLVMIHGEQDGVIANDLGKKLFRLAPVSDKRFLSINGAGHNDLYSSGKTVNALLDAMDNALTNTSGEAEPAADGQQD
ncbi:MAG: alpha/beta hydrolase [Alphaproteobacteria bacterium]